MLAVTHPYGTQAAARRFSHGARWNALISTYIGTIFAPPGLLAWVRLQSHQKYHQSFAIRSAASAL